MKILVSIVTYNRLNLLQNLYKALKRQTYDNFDLLIINNSSNDGTQLWLNSLKDIIVIKQDNSGSSGGQFTAFKYALENNYDYLWAMDDDVLPEDNCLEELIKNSNNNTVLVPLRITPKSEIFYNECKYFNFTNPFKSLWKEIIKKEDLNDEIIQIEGATFEGMFVPINIIDKVGLPNKFYFIFADDTDYCIRLLKNNYKIYLVKNAIMKRQLNLIENTYLFNDWKAYYIIRNIFLLDRLYGNILVKNLRPLFYFFKFLIKVKRLEDIKVLNKAFFDAYLYKV